MSEDKELVEVWRGDLERFRAKIEMITESGCWIWMGALSSNGYGSFQYKRERRGAHVA